MDLVSPHLIQDAAAPVALPVLPLLIPQPPHPSLRAVVVIPAKDEAHHLPATLAALVAQVWAPGRRVPPGSFELLILANNCSDATAAVARAVAAQYAGWAIHVIERHLPPAEAHVGRARRLLMDAAARRLEQVGRPRGIILSTDADTEVAPNWLLATWQDLAAGADAVGGRIFPRHSGHQACPVRRHHLRDTAYRLARTQLEARLNPDPADPWPRHHQHFGGSLALTVAAYRRVGGLPVVPYLEDEALYQALRRHDLRVRHSPAVRVYTSDRQEGRVAVGLSWQLREWGRQWALGQEPEVEGAAQIQAEAILRQRLRQLWPQPTSSPAAVALINQLAQELQLIPAELQAAVAAHATLGRLAEWAVARLRTIQSFRPVPLSVALHQVREALRAF